MDTRATATAQQMVDELPGLNPARSLRHEATESGTTTETLRQFIADEIVCTAKLHGHQSIGTIQGIADAQAGEIMRKAREAFKHAELLKALRGDAGVNAAHDELSGLIEEGESDDAIRNAAVDMCAALNAANQRRESLLNEIEGAA